MRLLAIDIGGANLKVADGRGFARSVVFPLWLQPAELDDALERLLATAPPADALAVTMTGELADCFETKAQGVGAILDAAQRAAGQRGLLIYLVDGQLVPVDAVRQKPLLAAASNWHALADFSRRYLHGDAGVLVDIGSTTTDIVPLSVTGPAATGRHDTQRLAAGELVYSGVERSPVCAVVRQLPWQGQACPVAQELFATTLDAYLLLDEIDESEATDHTADGRARTKACAHARLARAVCADRSLFNQHDARQAAAAICEAQLAMLESALRQVLARSPAMPWVILSGSGEFLGRRLIDRLDDATEAISLSAELGPEVSRCATAHALAVLAVERSAG